MGAKSRQKKKKLEAQQQQIALEQQEAHKDSCPKQATIDPAAPGFNIKTYTPANLSCYDQLFELPLSAKSQKAEDKRFVKLASRGDKTVLLLDHTEFPAVEMKLSCIYVVAIVIPSEPSMQAFDGNELAVYFYTYDGNGRRVEIPIDPVASTEIQRCMRAQKGCSFDKLNQLDYHPLYNQSYLQVIEFCPRHFNKYVTRVGVALPKQFDFAGLKPLVNAKRNSEKAEEERAEEFLRMLGDVE